MEILLTHTSAEVFPVIYANVEGFCWNESPIPIPNLKKQNGDWESHAAEVIPKEQIIPSEQELSKPNNLTQIQELVKQNCSWSGRNNSKCW